MPKFIVQLLILCVLPLINVSRAQESSSAGGSIDDSLPQQQPQPQQSSASGSVPAAATEAEASQPTVNVTPTSNQQRQEPGPNGGDAFAANSSALDTNSLPKCGTKETDFAPCIPKDRANNLFKHCCQQYAPEGCHSLCQYETDELTARNMLLQTVKTRKCDLKHMSTILYCASQNQDNRKCCEYLNLADSKLGVGNRCLRFCDPAGEGITSIARTDVTCLFNWNVLMYCHHSGIKLS